MSKRFFRRLNKGRTEPTAAFHATRNQSRYVLAELAGAGSYMISMGHLVKGPFDATRFLCAARAMVARHDALRTQFQLSGQEVLAVIEPEPRFRFEIKEFPDTSLDAFRTWALPHVFDDVDPLQPGSLIRFVVADYGTAWRFTIAAHHAITDGFSRGVMNRELLKLYAGEDLPDASSYYAHASGETTTGPALDEVVEALPSPARIFSGGGSALQENAAGQFVEHDFSAMAQPLRRLAKTTDSTRFAVLSSVYALTLSGQTGTRRLSSFFQSEGRKCVGASNSVVGPFSNTLPLDLSFEPDRPFIAFAQEMSQRVKNLLALETQPVMTVLAEMNKVPTISLNQYPPASRITAGTLEVGPRELLDRRTEYDLNLVWTDDSGRLAARAFYNPAIISEARANLFLSQYGALLRHAISDPTQSCEEILTAARSDHLAVFPRPGNASRPTRRLHEKFFEKAQEIPEAVAVVTTSGHVTRGMLADRAMAYRTALGHAGAGGGDRVAVLARRCPDMVAAILGVSASGSSFALIDSSYPASRIETMLDMLAPAYLIIAGEGIAEVTAEGIATVLPDTDAQRLEPVTGPPREAAYHLFTSGTTGVPKLVTHPETTVQRFIDWQADCLGQDGPHPTTMMMSGLSHDPVLRDILLPLTTGGKLAIPTEEEMLHPCILRALSKTAEVTVLHLTPASGRLLALGSDVATYAKVQAVFWGGDRLLARQAAQWQRLAPAARQLNLYGATETPQAALYHAVDPDDTGEARVPLGRPTTWTGARILGADGMPVAFGEIGEIVIELDAPVGGAMQSSATETAPSHATGDFGYAMPDGIIHFVGRSDRQVQVNSNRVELAEIEAAAERLDGVASAAALIGGTDADQIWLFIAQGGSDVTQASLRAALSRSLPSHMLPAKIELRERLPVTQNAKVDYDALRADMRNASSGTPSDLPAGDDERAIADVFRRNAGSAVVHRMQSLADTGADSLSMIEVRLDLEARGFELPEGWEWMPISALAQHRVTPALDKVKAHRLLAPVRLDTWMLIRCLAIVQIVINHAGFPFFDGASVLLIAFAGLSFGQMQLPAIVSDARTGRVWAQVAKLLIPLVPASLVIYSLLVMFGRNPNPAALMFYQNLVPLIDSQIQGIDVRRHQINWLWFLHAYLQIFVGLGVLLAIPRILDWVRKRFWQAALGLFGVSWLLMLTSYGLVLTYGKNPNTVPEDLAWAPTSMLPFFCLGLLCALATSRDRITLVALLATTHFALMKWGLHMHEEWLWLAGLALCLCVHSLKAPRVVATVVTAVSAHSLMIYLSHMPVIVLITRGFSERPPVSVMLLVALCVGVAIGHAFRPVYRVLGVHRLANSKVMFWSRNDSEAPVSVVKDTQRSET